MNDSRIQRFADFLVGLGNDGDQAMFTRGLPEWIVKEALRLVPERRVFFQRQRDAEFFGAHIRRLDERIPEKQIIQMLQEQITSVLAEAEKLEQDPGTFFRFLSVIPMSHRTAISGMAAVEWYGKQGIVSRNIHPSVFQDYVGIPQYPYFVYDVRFVRRNEFDSEKFEFLGISELLAFCAHADIPAFPRGVHELCALRPIVSGTEGSLVASVSSLTPPKLDLISRDSIPEDALVPVRRRMEGE